jgi:hypothetical protein
MANKKSTFRTMAEALTFNKLGSVDVSLNHLDKRKLSIDEIKSVIREAFKDAKDTASVEAQELAHGWGDADIENEVNWAEKLNIKEFFEIREEETEKGESEDKEEEE